ncbi:hypothetical protein GQ53DRAFT_801137 [Thozetella sp. PMI_491]|nr:hypothetical protein GQ53DRAFT_801137 [Thozetella sp. PMI_491]
MSMGLSPSDILEAIKICKWIWDNCFDKNNTADQRYRKFGRDINGLQIQIGRVQDSIQSAIDELDPQERRSGNLEQELQDVAGNFLDTLERCKDLLNDRKYIGLKKDRAGFVTNIVWATTTPAKVDGLCREIQFHTQRLSLISKPVDTDLLVAIRRDLSEVVEWSRSQRPELRAQASELVPSWLRDVFATNITINPPPTVPDPRDIPMKAGCDILCRHYSGREHHDKITDPKRRIIHRYLTLFKYISLDLQTSSHTRGAEIDEKELLDLQKESNEPFLIWDPPVLRQIVSPTDKEDDEEHILTLSLVTPESLLIFQNDRMCLRIVPTEETNGQVRLSRHHRGEVRFNARIDRFIALYTVLDPESEHANTVQIYHEGSRVPLTYNLKGLQDAWLFQQAVTGYEVKEHQMGVTWSAQKPVEAKKLRFRLTAAKCKYLELEFPTPEDRQDFSDRFEIEMGQYNETETAYYTYKETEKYMDDRPHRSPSNGKAASVYLDPSSRRSSFVSAFSQDPRRSPVRQRLSRIDSMDLDSKDGRT